MKGIDGCRSKGKCRKDSGETHVVFTCGDVNNVKIGRVAFDFSQMEFMRSFRCEMDQSQIFVRCWKFILNRPTSSLEIFGKEVFGCVSEVHVRSFRRAPS